MGLFSFAFTGAALILIGAWESLSSPSRKPNRHSTVTLLGGASLSFLLLLSSLISLLSAVNDSIAVPLNLQSLAVFSLFLLFSLLALFSNLPYLLLNFILLLAFIQEFLFFYLRIQHHSSVEARYFDLMLIPIAVCVFSTAIELYSPQSHAPRIARGIGLVLQGSWLIQMGFSFFSSWIAVNCGLRQKSSGNYTIQCKGHMDDHRAKAIAILLFNCQLAFLVSVIVSVYSVVSGKKSKEYSRYRPLEAEMANQPQFSLESDEEDLDNGESKQEQGSG